MQTCRWLCRWSRIQCSRANTSGGKRGRKEWALCTPAHGTRAWGGRECERVKVWNYEQRKLPHVRAALCSKPITQQDSTKGTKCKPSSIEQGLRELSCAAST